MTSVSFPLIPGKPDVDFRFTIATARQLDKASEYGVQVLLKNGQTTDAIVLMTCYGLRHINPKMTEAKAEELIQQFIDGGGDAMDLFNALFKALQASGVFGKVDGVDANPTTAATMTPQPVTTE
jgi:hypothetical protein